MTKQSRRHFFASLAGIAGALGLRNHLSIQGDPRLYKKLERAYDMVTFRGVPLEWDEYLPQHDEGMHDFLAKELFKPNPVMKHLKRITNIQEPEGY